jgi:hypothetical protein
MGQQIMKARASRKEKPLYEQPRPAGMKSKTMTGAQKAEAAKIAKKGGDKKVGLFARINAMKKVKG